MIAEGKEREFYMYLGSYYILEPPTGAAHGFGRFLHVIVYTEPIINQIHQIVMCWSLNGLVETGPNRQRRKSRNREKAS